MTILEKLQLAVTFGLILLLTCLHFALQSTGYSATVTLGHDARITQLAALETSKVAVRGHR